MKIIFNSDMLYSKTPRRAQLPQHVLNFLAACVADGHEILIPEATRLEFEQKQKILRETAIEELGRARDLLIGNNVEVPDFDLEGSIAPISLMALMTKVEGLNVKEVTADLEEYHSALRRACLRQLPHPPETKSDEMRDLVIWETALRFAMADGKALLLSRDEVHVHHRGDLEAAGAGLVRIGDFERAQEHLLIATASGTQISNLLRTRWPEIINSGLPVIEGANITSILAPLFSDRDDGSTEVEATVGFSSGDGAKIVAELQMIFSGNLPISITFSDIKRDAVKIAQPVELKFNDVQADASDIKERLDELKSLLGGN